jgi:hypothetical protein
MGPISVSELGGVAHRGGAVAAADFGGSGNDRGHEVRGAGAKGVAHGMLAREDERGEEKG